MFQGLSYIGVYESQLNPPLSIDCYSGAFVALMFAVEGTRMQHDVMQDVYLWIGPLAFLIKTALSGFVIASVLWPFHSRHRIAVLEEAQRATGLRSSIKHILLNRWDVVFGKRLTTYQVASMGNNRTDSQTFWSIIG